MEIFNSFERCLLEEKVSLEIDIAKYEKIRESKKYSADQLEKWYKSLMKRRSQFEKNEKLYNVLRTLNVLPLHEQIQNLVSKDQNISGRSDRNWSAHISKTESGYIVFMLPPSKK